MAEYTKIGLLFMIIGSLLGLAGIIPATNMIVAMVIVTIGGSGALLALVGLIFIFVGRGEFGKEHHDSVYRALILFLMSIVTMALTVVLTVMAFMEDNSVMMMAVYATIFAGGVFSVLFHYFLIHRLQDGFGRKVLIAGVIIGLSYYGLLAVTMGMMEWEVDQEEDMDERNDIRESYDMLAYVYLGLSAFSSILFLLAVYLAYMRIHRGDLVPIPPPLVYYQYTYPCPQCGRPLEHMREHQKWWCEDCGRSY